MSLADDPKLRTALCLMHLRSDHWVPLGTSTKLSTKHQSRLGGPVIVAQLLAEVTAHSIVNWMTENFHKQEVLPDGSLEELDLTPGLVALSIDPPLEERKKERIVNIEHELLEKKASRQSWKPSKQLRDAAYARAQTMIMDKLVSGRAVGVIVR